MSSDPFPPAPTDPAGRPGSPSASASNPFAPAEPVATEGLRPVEVVPVRPRRGVGALLVNALLGVALIVAIGGVAFAVGRATAPATTAAVGRTGGNGQGGGGQFFPNASGAPGRGAFGGGGFGGAVAVQGTVEAVDATSITIKTAAGTTVTLGLDGQTTYHQQSAASVTEVKTGSTVIVQLQGRGFGGQGRPDGSSAPTASGTPAAGFGTARSVTIAPAGS